MSVLHTVAVRTFTAADSANARRWHAAETDSTLGRGRTSRAVLLAWAAAGAPTVDPAPTVVATVEYRNLDSTGRPNGPVRFRDILSDAMPGGRGRPATLSYLHAGGFDPTKHAVRQIVTAQGALHSVHTDDSDDYVIAWESKSDQAAVIVALLKTIAERDATIAGLTGRN